MNIIRTRAVELAAIPAIAYKQKLTTAAGSGIRILRMDTDASATFTIDRRTGEPTPYGKVDADLFPDEAIFEAQELTSGLPYTARGKLKVTITEPADVSADDVLETNEEEVDMVDSPEYEAIIDRYTDEDGKLNYALMNKDFIQFASRSTVVGQMIADWANADDILLYVVGSRAINLSGRKDNLTAEQTKALIETLDEISLRSAFKELSLHIRRLLSKSK